MNDPVGPVAISFQGSLTAMDEQIPFDNVGRMGELQNLISKPELNGLKVNIGVYNTTHRYAASSTSRLQGKLFTIAVKPENLKLSEPISFCDRYSEAPVVVGNFDKSVDAGTIVEFSECPPFNKKTQSWLLKQPSLIRSTSTQSNEHGHSCLQFSRAAVISIEDALDEPVEFSYLNFDIPSKEGAGHCARGRNVTFRHCRFSSLGNGFSIGDRNRLGDNAGRASVVFEDCVFEDCGAGAGLVVAGEGHATLRRCVFRNNHTGIEVKDGGSATLVDCSVYNSVLAGIHVHSQGRCVDILNSTVETSAQHGVLVTDGCTARMHNITISHCEDSGVHVQGGASSTTVSMESSAVSHCLRGLTTRAGKVKVAVNATKVIQNSDIGVSIEEGSVGEASLTGCEVKTNSNRDIMGGIETCSLLVDGVQYIQKNE